MSRNRKYMIRVKTVSGEKSCFRRVENDGQTIMMQKVKEGKRPEWKFTFERSSVYPVRRLGVWWPTIDVHRGSPKAITYDMEAKTVIQPHWTKEDSQKFIETDFLKNLLHAISESEKLRQLLTFSLLLTLMTLVSVLYLILKIMGLIR